MDDLPISPDGRAHARVAAWSVKIATISGAGQAIGRTSTLSRLMSALKDASC